MTDLTTPAKGPRLATLDALRGMAILGILAVNAALFASPLDEALSPANWWARPQTDASLTTFWVMQTFFEAKMISMFSMLFGVSIFLVGGERRDPQRSPVLRRRLLWLLLFGVLHGLLIWYGDILFTYAISGLVVMLARSWPASRLLKVGLGIWLAGIAFYTFAAWGMQFAPEGTSMAPPAEAFRAGYAGTFLESLAANARDWLQFLAFQPFFIALTTAPLMLVGMGLYKSGFLKGQASTRGYLAAVGAAALGLSLIGVFTMVDIRNGFAAPLHHFSDALTFLTALPITLGYGSLLMLGLRAGGAAAAIPNLLRPVGRMAFTNYLTQSLIMTSLFYGGRGPGWFQEVDRPGLALIVVGVWVLQIVWSHLWLARFQMGPFEWVWRSLVAKRRLPLSRDETSAGAA